MAATQTGEDKPTNRETKPDGPPKSWKKIKEEQKALKRQRKQEKLIKSSENAKHLEELKQTVSKREPEKPIPSTISIAVPGSILENAQSAELRAYLAGQVARAAVIYRVNEIIVFDDVGLATARETKLNFESDSNGNNTTVRSSSLQLARILQYLECPQYLRKYFFPIHKDLKYSGLLNPLDTPHHLRRESTFLYREGVISDKKAKEGHSYANVGLLNDVLVNKGVEPGVRVTVKLEAQTGEAKKKMRGFVVSPDEPRRETGVYWGYQVRIAHSLSEIFTKSPYSNGYDVTIGTSDRGTNVHEVAQKSIEYSHLLLLFGGLQGLEAALSNDDKLTVDDPALLFDHYINVLPKQGTRTIRTEEALLIALAAVQEKLQPNTPELDTDLSGYLPSSEDTGITLTRNDLIGHKRNKFKNQQQQETNETMEIKKKRYDSDHSDKEPKIMQAQSLESNNKEAVTIDEFEVVPAKQEHQPVDKPTNEKINAGDLSRFD